MDPIYLRDVIDIPESVHAGDFKVELTGGFTDTAARVAEYVVTDQLRTAFDRSLKLVRAAVRDGTSHAAYLHGSFGSGKSHFLTVLHAILNNDPAARQKTGLQQVIVEHDGWLSGRRFLMVPYHLIGAADIDSAVLGGYVAAIRRLHPDAPTPPVYRADAMLADAHRQRQFLGDDATFVRWLAAGAVAVPAAAVDDLGDVDDLDDLDMGAGLASVSQWGSVELDRAFAASAGDPMRDALVSALLSGPMSAYDRGASGDANAFVPLENGLAAMSRHAQALGYDGLILFLDELILWLQAHMSDQRFVNTQVSKLVKLIESGDADRPVPIVSFISRQRDLSKLVGKDVTGADVKNLEAQVEYLAGRFDVVELEDRNLPAIIAERVLRPKSDEAREQLDQAFAMVESSSAADREVLLDAQGVTKADWSEFRAVYPLSPALLNVLVVLSGALQRERSGLKLLQEMLHRRREDMRLGDLIPMGDLWDVLMDGTGEAFTDRLRHDAEAAHRFHTRVRAYLLDKYGSDSNPDFVADDRFVKTLLLSVLASDVPALDRLTGSRLAALNHGSLRSRMVAPGRLVGRRLNELQGEFGGELRSEGDEDPVFSLHLSDLDIEPLLAAAAGEDKTGVRRIWIKDQLWRALDVRDRDEFVCEHEVVWRGTRRTVELVFGNVWDPAELSDGQFQPTVDGRVRVIFDYPFDAAHKYPSHDVSRVRNLMRNGVTGATVVWLPHFFSAQRSAQLGKLMKINHLLERDLLDTRYAAHLPSDERAAVRQQLTAQRDNLTSQLSAALTQVYGIAGVDEATVGTHVGESGHVLSLLPGHTPRLQGGADFAHNLRGLTDGLFDVLFPKHPNLDPGSNRRPVTLAELRTVLTWITRAMEDGERRVVVDKANLVLVRKVVHALDLGEVSDGPLNLSTEWQRRIDQYAAAHQITGDYPVEDMRRWIAELGYTGLDRPVSGLIISAYALLADRAWVRHGAVLTQPPSLEQIGPGYVLRAERLPTAEEFATARARAAELFGVHSPDLLFARNVAKLAAGVQEKLAGWEGPITLLRQALRDRADDLGLGVEPSPRTEAARHAADLLARLGRSSDATGLVQELAGAAYPVDDRILAKTMSSAEPIAAALADVQWSLLRPVRAMVDRDDALGSQARSLVEELARVAAADEWTKPLEPLLRRLNSGAAALATEAARLASVTTNPDQSPAVVPTPRKPSTQDGFGQEGTAAAATGGASTPSPGAIPDRPDHHGVADPTEGATSSDPSGGETPSQPVHGRRVGTGRGEKLVEMLEQLRSEIDRFTVVHPGVEVEISWRVVPTSLDEVADGGSAGSGPGA